MTSIQLNTIYNEDCLETMKRMPDGFVDLVLTDPPYGIDFQSSRTIERLRKPKIANDKEPYVEWMEEAFRVLKDGGTMFCFYRWDVANAFIEEGKRVGFRVKSEIVWDKVAHGMGDLKGSFAPQHETIMFCTKGNYKFPANRPATVIKAMRVSPEKLKHPNEKPVDLIKRLVHAVATKESIVYDPFMGSGATARACKDLGHNYIGSEISKEYCDIAEKRLRQEVLL